MSYDDVRQVLRDLGYGEDAKPRTAGYSNPRHQQVEEPAEVEPVEVDTPRRNTTSTRPIPTGDPGPRMAPTGGTEPFKVEIDYRREARALADKVWAQRNF